MDDQRFDAIARSLATGPSRRAVLKGMLGLGGVAVASAAAWPDHAHAARRGFTGPQFPTPCVPQCDGTTCGADGCGGTCRCARTLPICVFGTELCFASCEPLDPTPDCGSGCICDAADSVCISGQTFGACSLPNDCPTGTFCYDATCRAPCTNDA